MKIRILIVFILSVNLSLHSQTAFQRVIGNANSIFTRHAIQLADTAYLITGASSGYGDYTANAFLMKVDSMANHLWTKSYGGSNADWAMQVLENPDGTIVFTGYTNSFGNGGYDIYLVKTDANGNLLWQKTFGGSDWDFGKTIVRSNDGGYLIGGSTYSFGSGNKDAFILKTDSNGDSLWMQTYGDVLDDEVNRLIATGDGNFAFTGVTHNSSDTIGNIWLVKIDSLGNFMWQQQFGTAEKGGTSIYLSATNKDILLIATVDSLSSAGKDMYVIRTDSMGGIICNTLYSLSGEESAADIAERVSNGTIYIVGLTDSYGQGGGDFVNYYGSQYCFYTGGETFGFPQRDEAKAVVVTHDNSYMIAGITEEGPGPYNMYLVKLDSALTIPAPAVTTYFDISDLNQLEEIKNSFIVYPNPAGSSFTLKTDQFSSVHQWYIHDLSGRICMTFFQTSSEQLVDINMLLPGTYVITDHYGIKPSLLIVSR